MVWAGPEVHRAKCHPEGASSSYVYLWTLHGCACHLNSNLSQQGDESTHLRVPEAICRLHHLHILKTPITKGPENQLEHLIQWTPFNCCEQKYILANQLILLIKFEMIHASLLVGWMFYQYAQMLSETYLCPPILAELTPSLITHMMYIHGTLHNTSQLH